MTSAGTDGEPMRTLDAVRALVGMTTEPVEVSWTEQDVMLYALGVGAGAADPLAELALTTENSAGHRLRVLPTFAGSLLLKVRPAWQPWGPGPVVHAGHAVSLARPLEAEGTVVARARIEAVHDRGSGALVLSRTTAVSVDGAPAFTVTNGAYVVGGGGFGGGRGPDVARRVPERRPDGRLTVETRSDQALLFRLSGDRNRLHSDPVFAAAAGFRRPILHGLATSGIGVRMLVGSLCDGDPDRVSDVAVRYTAPVTPGEVLTVSYWDEPEGIRFQMHGGSGQLACDRGLLTLRGTAPLP